MYARLDQKLPEGKEWLYEVKFDGYRCLAGRNSSGVMLWSRSENLFTGQFPKIARACEGLPVGTLIDDEIVALNEQGRISFERGNKFIPTRQIELIKLWDKIDHARAIAVT